MSRVVENISDDIVSLLLSDRDSLGRSFIRRIYVELGDTPRLLKCPIKTVLEPGNLGCFDDNGVSPSSVCKSRTGDMHLYYIGWKPRSTVRFGLFGGLATSSGNSLNYTRNSRAPLFSLSDEEPYHVLTAPWVIYDSDDDIFKM